MTTGPPDEHAAITKVMTTVSSGQSSFVEADRASCGDGRRAAFVAESGCLGEHPAPRMPGMVEQVDARTSRVRMLSPREHVLSAWQARPAAESSPEEGCPVASPDRNNVHSTAVTHTSSSQGCGMAMTARLRRRKQRSDPLPSSAGSACWQI